MSYVREQRNWLEYNEIGKGDWLMVIQSADSWEDGWDNEWIEDMDNYIGEMGQITRISKEGIELRFEDGCSYEFPYFALEYFDED